MFLPQKWVNQKTSEKVLLKSFPMNGHVGMFPKNLKCFRGNFCVLSLVTEVAISSERK
jgi:hypothetical protein